MRLSHKPDAPENSCDRVTKPGREARRLRRPMALRVHICHLNRHRPCRRVGRLCVANNSALLCDSLKCGPFVWAILRDLTNVSRICPESGEDFAPLEASVRTPRVLLARYSTLWWTCPVGQIWSADGDARSWS